MKDALVTINQVDVTPDLKNAHVYVSVLGSGSGAAVIAQLEAHRVALQTELARHVVLKYTPHLIFHLDDSIERGARVIEILQEIETPGEQERVSAATFSEIGQALREHQRFAVLSHVRPDGDALGSQLALALSLEKLGKTVRVWNEDGMLEKYSFLPRAELLTKPPADKGRRRCCRSPRHRRANPPRHYARRHRFGETLDQHRSSSEQSRLTAISSISIPLRPPPAKFFSI